MNVVSALGQCRRMDVAQWSAHRHGLGAREKSQDYVWETWVGVLEMKIGCIGTYSAIGLSIDTQDTVCRIFPPIYLN